VVAWASASRTEGESAASTRAVPRQLGQAVRSTLNGHLEGRKGNDTMDLSGGSGRPGYYSSSGPTRAAAVAYAALHGTRRRQALPAPQLLHARRQSRRQYALHTVSARHTAMLRRCHHPQTPTLYLSG
jgi:hypothetical protein